MPHVYIILFLSFMVSISCNKDTSETPVEETSVTIQTEEAKEKEASIEEDITIYNNSIIGVFPGHTLSTHMHKITEGVLLNGNGEKKIYQLDSKDHGALGFIATDPKNQSLVGDITIGNPYAKTVKGIAPDDTFGDLLKAYNTTDFKINSADSKTYATLGNLSFRLDILHASKIEQISPKTRILEIVIRR